MTHLSVVVPVYQAEDCVEELCRRVQLALEEITFNYEILLIDDRSTDRSWANISAASRKDSRIKGRRMSRNFGQHRAITAGLDQACGDWVIVMDCDLQDPPEAIPQLYSKAQEGFEIVIAKFSERSESSVRQAVSRAFWRNLSWLAGMDFDPGIGNYRIMSRVVVENFRGYREQLRLVGGITNLMGFTTTTIMVERSGRFAGETSYSFKRLVGIAMDSTIAYSDKPLKSSVAFGLFLSAVSFGVASAGLALGILGMIDVPGWASVMVSLFLLSGVVIANLGVIGLYLGKIFDESKRRPLYVLEDSTDGAGLKYWIAPQNKCDVKVVWIVGGENSGKSLLGREVVAQLIAAGESAVLLQEEELEFESANIIVREDGNVDEAKLKKSYRFAALSSSLANQGFTVILTTSYVVEEVRMWNKINQPRYFQVHLRQPLLAHGMPNNDDRSYLRGLEEARNVKISGINHDVEATSDLVIDSVEGPNARPTAKLLIHNFSRSVRSHFLSE